MTERKSSPQSSAVSKNRRARAGTLGSGWPPGPEDERGPLHQALLAVSLTLSQSPGHHRPGLLPSEEPHQR